MHPECKRKSRIIRSNAVFEASGLVTLTIVDDFCMNCYLGMKPLDFRERSFSETYGLALQNHKHNLFKLMETALLDGFQQHQQLKWIANVTRRENDSMSQMLMFHTPSKKKLERKPPKKGKKLYDFVLSFRFPWFERSGQLVKFRKYERNSSCDWK